MAIVFHILWAFVLLAFCGYGVTRLLCGSDKRFAPYVLIAGYAFSQILYIIFYLLLTGESHIAAASVLVLAFLLFVVTSVGARSRTILREWLGELRGGRNLIYAATVVFLVAGLPYLASGWGNYWHSANEDSFDSLTGGDAFYKSRVLGASDNLGWRKLSLEEIIERNTKVRKEVQHNYILDPARGQYSSMGFWREILGKTNGMDLFLIQSLVNLILMLQGVYLFARRVGGVGTSLALMVALGSVLNNFYLTTYFNSHMGSLMAMSALPFMLTAFVNWVDGKFPRRGLWLIGLLLLFVANAYPYPLPYFVIPMAIYLYAIRSSWYAGAPSGEGRWITPLAIQGVPKSFGIATYRGRLLLWTVVAVVTVALLVMSWELAAPLRERVDQVDRSWMTMLNHVGIFQYWGIWHSPVVFGPTPISLFDRIAVVVGVSWVLVGILIMVALMGLVVAVRRGRHFFEVFAICWVVFFILMRMVVRDPYYLYKFLYITQFVVVLMVVLGFYHLWGSSRRIQIMLGGVLLMLVGLNLGNNLMPISDLMKRDYNTSIGQYYQLAEFDEQTLSRTYLDIPRYDYKDVILMLLLEKKIDPHFRKRDAQYVLVKKGLSDVVIESPGRLLWENKLFELRLPPSQNVIQVDTLWDPIIRVDTLWDPKKEEKDEMFERTRGRWIGEKAYGAWFVDIGRRSQDAKYLYVCAESGPSNNFGEVDVSLSDNSEKKLARFIVSQRKCDFFPLEGIADDQFPLAFHNHTVGKPASSVDPRRLHIRLFQVGVSDGKYNWPIIELLNSDLDMIKSTPHDVHAEGAFVGHGWYPLENYKGERFHWMPRQAELVVYSPTGGGGELVLQLESGPGLSPNRESVRLIDPAGHIQEFPLKGRQTITLPLSGLQKGFNVIKLQAEAKAPDSGSDRRTLAARLMSLEWKPAK